MSDKHFEAYVEGTLSVAKRQFSTIKWAANAWEKSKKHRT